MSRLTHKLKKGTKILREQGVGTFARRFGAFVVDGTRYVSRESYLRLNAKSISKDLRAFSSEDPETTYRFVERGFFGSLAPIQIHEEFLGLLGVFKGIKPKVAMEIGTMQGGAFFCFAKLAEKDATLISIDLPNGAMGGGFAAGYPAWKEPIYRSFGRPGQEIALLREDSHAQTTLKKVKEILKGKQIDFLFIDGDHTYEGVKEDFIMYSPLVRKGGVIAFHDVAPKASDESSGGVKHFWKELKAQYKHQEFIQDPEETGCGIGVLYEHPAA